jgi:hypothetical protein
MIEIIAAILLADTKEFQSLTVGTNAYNGVTLRKRNAAEAVLKFDKGLTVVKIEDLPEPLKSEWLNPTELDKLKQSESQQNAKRKDFEDSKRRAYLAQNFVAIDGKLVNRDKLSRVMCETERIIRGSIFGRTYHDEVIREPSQLSESQRQGRGVVSFPNLNLRREISRRTIYGEYVLIKNAPSSATGTKQNCEAYDTGKTELVNGITAKVYDCGKLPEFEPGSAILKPTK